MPNAIARIGREKTLRTLADRLFVIEGPDKAAKLRRAERALLRANPALAREDAFRAGRVVLVPSNIGLVPSERVETPGSDLTGLLRESTQRLQMADTAVRNGFEKARQSDDVALSWLRKRSFIKKLKKASPESAELATAALPKIEERRGEAERREAEVIKAIEAAITEVDKLQRLIRRD